MSWWKLAREVRGFMFLLPFMIIAAAVILLGMIPVLLHIIGYFLNYFFPL